MSESTALAVAGPTTAAAWDGKLNQAQLDLFNRACHGATPEERNLLFQTAAAMGLNPVIGGFIHGVKRWDGRAKREVMQIQVGIGGYRLCALRTGEYEGRVGPEFCGEDGAWREAWPGSEPPVACRVGILRKGFQAPLYHVLHYSEAVQLTKEGAPNATWRKMPRTMLAKSTEAAALRAAFPDLLSGTYSPEELGREDFAQVGVTSDEVMVQRTTPELLEARKKLLGMFSSEEVCRRWIHDKANLELEEMALTDLEQAIRRVEIARAKKAEQEAQPPAAPAQPETDAKPSPAPGTLVNKLKQRVKLAADKLFGGDDAGVTLFYRWCDRRDLLAFSSAKNRPSIAESSLEELQACLQALDALTGEEVADFARECREYDAAQDAELAATTFKPDFEGALEVANEPWEDD